MRFEVHYALCILYLICRSVLGAICFSTKPHVGLQYSHIRLCRNGCQLLLFQKALFSSGWGVTGSNLSLGYQAKSSQIECMTTSCSSNCPTIGITQTRSMLVRLAVPVVCCTHDTWMSDMLSFIRDSHSWKRMLSSLCHCWASKLCYLLRCCLEQPLFWFVSLTGAFCFF